MSDCCCFINEGSTRGGNKGKSATKRKLSGNGDRKRKGTKERERGKKRKGKKKTHKHNAISNPTTTFSCAVHVCVCLSQFPFHSFTSSHFFNLFYIYRIFFLFSFIFLLFILLLSPHLTVHSKKRHAIYNTKCNAASKINLGAKIAHTIKWRRWRRTQRVVSKVLNVLRERNVAKAWVRSCICCWGCWCVCVCDCRRSFPSPSPSPPPFFSFSFPPSSATDEEDTNTHHPTNTTVHNSVPNVFRNNKQPPPRKIKFIKPYKGGRVLQTVELGVVARGEEKSTS